MLFTAAFVFTSCSNGSGSGGETPTPPAPTPRHAVTFSVEGGNGTLKAKADGIAETATSPINVEQGKTVTFTAKGNDDFVVDKWSVSSGSFESGTGTEGNNTAKLTVTAAVTVKVSFKAKPAGTVKYTVEHHKQNVTGDEYTKAEEETKYGKPAENTQAEAKPYEGFNAKPIEQKPVAGDGTTVVKVYYNRKEISLSLNLDGGSTTTPLSGGKLKGRFEAPVTVADPTKAGHIFTGWNPPLPATFPAEDGTHTAQWTPIPKYAVTFSVEGGNGTLKAKADGGTETETSPINVEQGKTVTFTAKPDPGYELKEWKVDDVALPGNTTNSYAFTVTKAVNVKVSFVRERIAITQVRAKAAPLVLGQTIPSGISYTYTDYEPSGVEGEPAKLIANNSTYGWQKKDGLEWVDVSGESCTEGIYQIQTQVRIDSPDSARYTLSPAIKVFVSFDDGDSYEEWSVSTPNNYAGYSYASVASKEHHVSSSDPFTLSSNSVSIPKSYVGKPITKVDVASLVSGGTRPYHFSITSGALPAGLSLREDGVISGTPEAAQAGQTAGIAQIRVYDEASPPAEKFIDVFCTEGIVDKKLVTFVVGWRGRAVPLAIEVDSGQPISPPAVPAAVNSYWTFSIWCTSEYYASYGTDAGGTWDFSEPVTKHMTLYARWSDNRTPITALTATMDPPVVGNPIPNSITYTYSADSHAKLLYLVPYTWRVWNGTGWEDASGTFESGKKYYIGTQMRIDLPDSKTYRLPTRATDITVTVNGQSWEIGNDIHNDIDYYNSEKVFSYVWCYSPDFEL
ncbi:InlB B-repeat-containing protein [Treponema socranskii]|uniref:InlB B-repeat-containing protein n=1 Tax=Treponema socranskii TaxID=53419 RepID=UPI003D6DE70B